MKKYIFFILVLFPIIICGDIPIFKSGSQVTSVFGEFRDIRFHMGMDLIPNVEGDTPVYSLTDGYLYRIKFKRLGYGKAVYVEAPDGLIYVYAHLKEFAPIFVNKIFLPKWKKEGIIYGDYYFNRENDLKIPIKKGQFIGYMGHSGVHTGDHVHFEMRENEIVAINPLSRFNFPDTIPPIIKDIYFTNYNNDRFLSIGCFDYMQNTHKLAIYKIQLNKNTILEFNKISYKNYKDGIDIYDRTFTSYDEYFYKIHISTFTNNISIFDHKNNSVDKIIKIPKEIYDKKNIIYNINKNKIIPIPKSYFSKSLKRKIRILSHSDLRYVIKKQKNKILLKIFPLFKTEQLTLNIKLKKKEGIFRIKNNRLFYLFKNSKVILYPGNYVIKVDKKAPMIKKVDGNIFIYDDSKIDYKRCYAVYKGKKLLIERDFDIGNDGNLIIFRKFNPNDKIKFYFYDIFGNKKMLKIKYHNLNFRINPFSNP